MIVLTKITIIFIIITVIKCVVGRNWGKQRAVRGQLRKSEQTACSAVPNEGIGGKKRAVQGQLRNSRQKEKTGGDN